MTAVSLSTETSASGRRSGLSPDEHLVRPGETLSGIAAERGVSLDALIRANPQIVNPNLIRPGQVLTLPSGGGEARSYAVHDGDTLSKIGAQFGVSWQAIAEANHLADPDRIRIGQDLRIPARDGGAHSPARPVATVNHASSTRPAAGALPETAGLSARQKFDL